MSPVAISPPSRSSRYPITDAVPPLRARQGDVLELAQVFLRRIAERTNKAVEGLTPEAAQRLVDYDWPGNVRELENCMERAVALTRTSEVAVDSLPDKVRNHRSSRLVIDADDPSELITLDEMEKRYVRRVLAACGGNKTQAAKVLGIDRRSLYRRLEGEQKDATKDQSKDITSPGGPLGPT
jgi:two-component system response regulator HydG